jgi:hypothetical protein
VEAAINSIRTGLEEMSVDQDIREELHLRI